MQNNKSSLEERLYAEQVSLLYEGPKFRPVLHIVSLIIILLIIIDHVNPYYAYTWALMLFGINIYRLFDIARIGKKLSLGEVNYERIHKHYACLAGMLGAIYGLGFVFFFNSIPMLSQVYILALFTTLVPAALVSFASDKLSFYLYSYFMAVPVITRIFVEGQLVYFNIGICAVIYFLIMRKLFLWNHNVLKNTITLKFENEDLYLSLQDANARLIELTVIDELTQIANRRSLDETLEKEWFRSKRMNTPISMLMIDIDHFKEYNDEFGHLKGDECLAYIADYLKDHINRSGDFVARYGGEEFCIIMPDTNINGAIKFAEQIHSGIRDLKIPNPHSSVSKYLTISIGVASTIPGDDDTYMDLLYTSDKALYNAKSDGRNIIRSKDILEKNLKPQLVL